ncbi:hypothetical protein SAMN05660642_01394 [Geodermatophilus siccatus]|uniref:Uncharacterized protein n=1 Tax=Geodermatophilus siccatus TaxID=1137991 RepID=A0A1G9PW67_9ACTN|nr:hypothetical protein SAMN05660642_01394 [Geodermatophilus siccatus]
MSGAAYGVEAELPAGWGDVSTPAGGGSWWVLAAGRPASATCELATRVAAATTTAAPCHRPDPCRCLRPGLDSSDM